MDSLDEKDLVLRMTKLVNYFKKDYTDIKDEVINNNKMNKMDSIINMVLKESNI